MMKKTFGAWIRGLRAEKRQSQVEASKALSVSEATFAAWEGEKRLPVKVSHVLRLAGWSGVERGEVFELVAQGLEGRVSAAV